MSESKFEEAIKFLGQCLKEKGLRVSKIILFGSQVKRKTSEGSDVDILIIIGGFPG